MRTPIALLATVGIAASAQAEVVFSNLGPGDSFNTNGNLVVGAASGLGDLFGDIDRGDEFVPTGSGAISTIEIALGRFTGANEFSLTLYDDASGTPGSVLWSSGAILGQMLPSALEAPPISVDVGGAASVTAGSRYWLIADVGEDTEATWKWNEAITFDNLQARSVDGGPFEILTGQVRGAFRVTTIPSPAGLAIAGMGGLLATRRRR